MKKKALFICIHNGKFADTRPGMLKWQDGDSKPNIGTHTDWLRKQAVQHQSSFIFEARIVISPQETRILNFEPAKPLETIPY